MDIEEEEERIRWASLTPAQQVAELEKDLPNLDGWNYRVLRHVQPDGTEWFAIHEVFYEVGGKPSMCSKDPDHAIGDDPEELRGAYELVMKAFAKPVLNYDDF